MAPDPMQPDREAADSWQNASLRRGNLYFDPIPPLGEPLPSAHRIEEYDFATVAEISTLLAHGKTGEERLLLYPQQGETALQFVEGARDTIQKLNRGDTLLVRLDRVCLLPAVAEALAQELFYRERVGGRRSLDKHVVLVNPDEDTQLVLHRALEIENDMCMALHTDATPWRLVYLGTLQPHLRSALDYIQAHPNALVLDLAATLGTSVGDVGRRMRELVENGLVDRVAHAGKVGKPAFTHTFYHPYAQYHREPASALTYELFIPWAAARAERLVMTAETAYYDNKFSLATTLGEKYLKLEEERRNPNGIAMAKRLLGLTAVRQKRFAQAEALLDAVIAIRQQLPDKEALSNALHNRGLAAAQQGDGQTALSYYRQCLELDREHGNKQKIAATLNNIANVYAEEKQFEESARYNIESLEIRDKYGDDHDRGRSLLSVARLAHHQGNLERFVRVYTAALKLHAEIKASIPPDEIPNYQQWFADAQRHLDSSVLAAAQEWGHETPLPDVIAYALAARV